MCVCGDVAEGRAEHLKLTPPQRQSFSPAISSVRTLSVRTNLCGHISPAAPAPVPVRRMLMARRYLTTAIGAVVLLSTALTMYQLGKRAGNDSPRPDIFMYARDSLPP